MVLLATVGTVTFGKEKTFVASKLWSVFAAPGAGSEPESVQGKLEHAHNTCHGASCFCIFSFSIFVLVFCLEACKLLMVSSLLLVLGPLKEMTIFRDVL